MNSKIINWFKSITVKEWIIFTILTLIIIGAIIGFVFIFTGSSNKRELPAMDNEYVFKEDEKLSINYSDYIYGEYEDPNDHKSVPSFHYAATYENNEHGIYFDKPYSIGDSIDPLDNINNKRVSTYATFVETEQQYVSKLSLVIDMDDKNDYSVGDIHIDIDYVFKSNGDDIPENSIGEWDNLIWEKIV